MHQTAIQGNHLAKFNNGKKETKSIANVPQPEVLGAYNNFSGGVNKQNLLVSEHFSYIRGKKMTMSIVHLDNWYVNCECIDYLPIFEQRQGRSQMFWLSKETYA